MKPRFLPVLAAVLALPLAACDSAAENNVEKTAEAIDDSAEAQADMTEAAAQGGPGEAVAEEQADQLRAEGEQTKDGLEDAADEMDGGEPQ